MSISQDVDHVWRRSGIGGSNSRNLQEIARRDSKAGVGTAKRAEQRQQISKEARQCRRPSKVNCTCRKSCCGLAPSEELGTSERTSEQAGERYLSIVEAIASPHEAVSGYLCIWNRLRAKDRISGRQSLEPRGAGLEHCTKADCVAGEGFCQ
ncbi:hypothetical protein NL676_025189 [Syzygium grande]|nr:hypothetical protein NL676_025189 [Syzygium grande]